MITSLTSETMHHLNDRTYLQLIIPYVDALHDMLFRIESLHKEYVKKYGHDPIHHIQSRIKTQKSIEGKLGRMNLPSTLECAGGALTDIAGLRIVCHFVWEIDLLVELIRQRIGWLILKERNYIQDPKDNGYRSYHLVFAVPVCRTDGVAYYPVELQLRTLSMDFWASMEHRICYKSDCEQSTTQEMLIEEFLGYAKQLEELEAKMERYWES